VRPSNRAVAEHVEHWHALHLDGYLGGPFEDRSGGLIIFDAEGEERAGRAVSSDPFLVGGLIEAYWLKRWLPESQTL